MVSEVIFFLFALLVYDILRKTQFKDLELHFMFISWFMAFFIFHSVYTIKDDRYFVTMAPALSYLLILGFSQINKILVFKIKYKNFLYYVLTVVLILMMLVSTVNYMNGIPDNESRSTMKLENIQMASKWIIDNDPAYKDKNIYSDQYPYFSWYLRTNVRPMPSFKTQELYENQLNAEKADYYLSIREGLNLTNYPPIKQFGFITIYKRN